MAETALAQPHKPSDWTAAVELPSLDEIKRVAGPTATVDSFAAQGTRMAEVIRSSIADFFGEIPQRLKVLDFGCGVGRVLLPLSQTVEAEWNACDVNPVAIDYLQRALPNVRCAVTDYQPPLPFEDGAFDCVYSVSIWTHLPISMQLPWLAEIRRVLRPGGLALITTAGSFVAAEWKTMTPDQFAEIGIAFKRSKAAFPGIDAPYGSTVLHPSFVTRVWGQVMPVLRIAPRAIENRQDLVTMTKL